MQKIEKFRWNRGDELNGFPGTGLDEDDFCGVEKIAIKRRQRGTSNIEMRVGAVEGIADYWMTQSAEVDANLMSTSRVKLNFEERRRADS